ncbi:MAG: hypothetical protein H0W73_11005 [Bacteroidetes bacterium]|nr:hypothetical protein [Bacteroidota bacterium]
MTKIITYILFSVSFFSFCQTNKTPNDSIFKKGDVIKIPQIVFCLDARGDENDSIFEKISSFLKSHKDLAFEIGSHTDSRGGARKNTDL